MNLLHLHLGCGLVHRPGWVNIDLYETAAADVQADAGLLPFGDGCAAAVDARQIIEHLGYVGGVYALHEWARALAPGGELRIETPDRDSTLAATTAQATSELALPWLFGDERCGLGHRYLFSPAELAALVERTGFEMVTVEPFEAASGRSAFRLTARRMADTPALRFAVRFHRNLVTAGVVDPRDAPQYLAALEEVCRQAGELTSAPSAEALAGLLGLTVRYSPAVGACALDALPDRAAWPAGELAQVQALVGDLAAKRFPARLACRWRDLAVPPAVAGVAWAGMEREISLYLAARLHPGAGLNAVRDAFDATTADPAPEDLAVTFFSRAALSDHAQRLTARGVRAFARGDLAAAERAFTVGLGYDADAPWPRWNLARLHLAQGRRLDALAAYEALQAVLHPGLRPAFERELDAMTGRAVDSAQYAVPLPDLADLLNRGSK